MDPTLNFNENFHAFGIWIINVGPLFSTKSWQGTSMYLEKQLSMQQTALERSVSTHVIQFCNIDKKNYECRMGKKF